MSLRSKFIVVVGGHDGTLETGRSFTRIVKCKCLGAQIDYTNVQVRACFTRTHELHASDITYSFVHQILRIKPPLSM